jgi:hypothetical protein
VSPWWSTSTSARSGVHGRIARSAPATSSRGPERPLVECERPGLLSEISVIPVSSDVAVDDNLRMLHRFVLVVGRARRRCYVEDLFGRAAQPHLCPGIPTPGAGRTRRPANSTVGMGPLISRGIDPGGVCGHRRAVEGTRDTGPSATLPPAWSSYDDNRVWRFTDGLQAWRR